MRRFLRGLSEVDTALVLGGVTLGAVKLWRRWYMSHHLQASYDTAAQTKVLHAMTGAGIFYRSNDQSYEGVEAANSGQVCQRSAPSTAWLPSCRATRLQPNRAWLASTLRASPSWS